MGFSQASQYADTMASQDAIIDSSLPLHEKLQRLRNIRQLAAKPEPGGSPLLRAAFGALLGIGVARGIGSAMGLGDASQSKIDMAGAAFGGLMGLSKSAHARDTKNAFRLGFLKAAKDAGYFTKVAFNPLAIVIDPLVGAGQAAKTVGSITGSGLAVLDSYDENDEDIMKLQVEKQLLKAHLEKAEAERKKELLRKILAKRTGA